jgi:hypothetical protein
MLARRRLIFTEHELSYECEEMLGRESIKLPTRLQRNFYAFKEAALPLIHGDWYFRNNRHRMPHQFSTSSSDDVAGIICEYTMKSITYQTDILNALLGILQSFAELDTPIYHLCGVPTLVPDSELRRVNLGPEKYLDGFIAGLFWELERYGSRRQSFPSWSWTGWAAPVGSFRPSGGRTLNGASLSIDISIIQDEGLPMHWNDYHKLCEARDIAALARIGQYPTLDITSPTIMISLRPQTYDTPLSASIRHMGRGPFDRRDDGQWFCTVCAGDEIMEGVFRSTKNPHDTDFWRRLYRQKWLGIVLGRGSSYREGGLGTTSLLVVEEELSGRYWERIGTAELSENTLQLDMLERRTIQLR